MAYIMRLNDRCYELRVSYRHFVAAIGKGTLTELRRLAMEKRLGRLPIVIHKSQGVNNGSNNDK